MKENQNPVSSHRRLKVYSKYFSRINSWYPSVFPEIRFCGKWLQDIGFEKGQTINVLQEKNKITITFEREEHSGDL